MAEKNVITAMLDDLSQQQPIATAICIGPNMAELQSDTAIQWTYFNASAFLNLPFSQRYDLAVVIFNPVDLQALSHAEQTQLLVKLRDLWAKRIVVLAHDVDASLLRALGFNHFNVSSADMNARDITLWQFNILNYKHVPDWLNAKYWANPENWDKYRW
ncbi:hypothetical protein EC844_12657 [Acinetobacter calcoaceticus]|uniref:Uncharacterized protein n=1 Tax=Acinetobacter calcoaceticus TaxID=471 RepID=A0A4R1XQJ1_ACICA|nr:hypothetical protein EC844_12657 [Acinetobacter calcoaceticus]